MSQLIGFGALYGRVPQRLRRPSPWLNRSGAEGDLKELNGWTPAKLTRYGTSARSTHAYRTYDRIMTDT
ncbi:MAG: hypothetical protein ACRDQX_11435 [Pseudonocardiaceae bacterium]